MQHDVKIYLLYKDVAVTLQGGFQNVYSHERLVLAQPG